MELLTLEQEINIMKELERYDTPTVTNVVGTYPEKDTCLCIYDSWNDNWYTDQSCRLWFPELGSRCGFAVTCTYTIATKDNNSKYGIGDLVKAVYDSPNPVVLVIKQDMETKHKNKNGLFGGNIANALKSVGCSAVITDGPSRDVEEVREAGIQYMITGLTAGHGPLSIKAINTPINVCGMDVVPNEIIHLDSNGAVKFPRKYLGEILEKCRIISKEEKRRFDLFKSTNNPDEITKIFNGLYD